MVVFGNIKAWLVGTHHEVSAKHLPRYLWEWAYRFIRRILRDDLHDFLIRRAVEYSTITYRQLVAGEQTTGTQRQRRLAPVLPIAIGAS